MSFIKKLTRYNVYRLVPSHIAVLLMLSVSNGLFAEENVIAFESPPMLAVLPFVSTGPGGDSEILASRIHDDLLTQLAGLQSIRVIARTSVAEYKDTVKNIGEIGKELHADAILEGSVQSTGDRILVNVQLIDAKTAKHLWTETYDRESSPASIFDVQTEIARAITSALRVTLTAQDATQLAAIPTENVAAYEAYHRALEIRDSAGIEEAAYRQALEEAVAQDPTFTRAWAELEGSLSFEYFRQKDPGLLQRAEQILDRIQTLAPKSGDYLIAQAYYNYYVLKNYDRALQIITQAQDMMPSDVRLVELKSWIQRRQGDSDGRVESLRLAHTLDPRNPRRTNSLVIDLMLTHRYEDAQVEIENSALQDFELSYWYNFLLLREHRDLGRWAEGVTKLQEESDGAGGLGATWEARIATRDYAAAEQLVDDMQERITPGEDPTSLSEKKLDQIITYSLMQQSDRLAELLIQARSILEKNRNSDGDLHPGDLNLEMAFVTAAEGNAEETERLVQRWRLGAAKDLAELTNYRQYSCQALGIAGATAAAVECIRTGLVEPSMVMPFMEPFLPYYDSMREDPLFVDLLADLDDAVNNP